MYYLLFLLLGCTYAPHNNPYGLELTQTIDEYQQSVATDPTMKLVNLADHIPNVVIDMRYATAENFTNKVVYDYPAALLRKPAAEALARVQQSLSLQGLGLKVYDAYRPYAATLSFYELIGDTNYVAAPWHGSRHNRGAAVDVTLIRLDTGEELPMPTPFDDFSEKAGPEYMDLPEHILRNRATLIQTMAEHGFTVYHSEWWHFDFIGWEQFGLLDLKISELIAIE